MSVCYNKFISTPASDPGPKTSTLTEHTIVNYRVPVIVSCLACGSRHLAEVIGCTSSRSNILTNPLGRIESKYDLD